MTQTNLPIIGYNLIILYLKKCLSLYCQMKYVSHKKRFQQFQGPSETLLSVTAHSYVLLFCESKDL